MAVVIAAAVARVGAFIPLSMVAARIRGVCALVGTLLSSAAVSVAVIMAFVYA